MKSYNLLRNTKVKTKLGLVVICMAIPIISLMLFLFSLQQSTINTTKIELQGIDYFYRVSVLLDQTIKSRNLTKMYLLGNRDQEKNINALHNKIDKEIQKLQNVSSLDRKINMDLSIKKVFDDWSRITEIWRTANIASFQTYYDDLHSDILLVLSQIVNNADLQLDAEIDTTLLIDIMVGTIPEISSSLGELQKLGIDVLFQNTVTIKDRANLVSAVARLERGIKELDQAMSTLEEHEASLFAKFEKMISDATAVSETVSAMSLKWLDSNSALDTEAEKYITIGSNAISKYQQLQSSIRNKLAELFQTRIKLAVFDRNMKLLFASLLTIIAIMVSVVTYRYITSQISSITNVFKQIDKGNIEARAQIYSIDELGSMASSLNDMLDRTLSLIQSQDERDAIQESIMKLLDEVSDVAKGDLTVEAEVTEDITGAIADSFNHMIYQLRNIVLNVQQATLEVGASASHMQETAEQLAEGSSAQAEQIIDSTAALDEMAVSIQQVSENATLSASVAEQALVNAKQGTQAVQNTIQGMQRIRTQVQETAKRIKRLGERSQEISEIVQLIGDIADRTSILALNASIQAARAGEAGRSFAVVAEEVERLAERATNATKQIGSLVNTIQSETNEAVIAMEESTHEVVQGSQVADKAGQALSEIESVSSRLAGLIQSISLAATQQARGSDNLSKAMNEISEVTQHTASGTKQTANAISQLASLADNLRGSVSTFKVPASFNHVDIDMTL